MLLQSVKKLLTSLGIDVRRAAANQMSKVSKGGRSTGKGKRNQQAQEN